ncbi:MAG: hypothetical protein K6F98_07145 [Bacteroidales bacterium]|nr:hypothetical protein [Bacteroidales bacterium]
MSYQFPTSLRRILLPAWILAGTLLLTQCNTGVQRQDDLFTRKISLAPEQVHPLVAAYTGGTVSAGTDIRLQLTDDPIRLQAAPGKPVDVPVFSLKPEVTGKTFWQDRRTLVFKPDAPLQHGTLYEVTVDMEKVADTRGMPALFNYKILTLPLTITVDRTSWTTSAATRGTYALTRTVLTSDRADNTQIEQCLNAALDGKQAAAVWTHDETGTRHTVRFENVRPESRLELDWNGRPLGIAFKREEKLQAPSDGRWEVVDVSLRYSPEFCIAVTCSAPLAKDQRVTDYITLASGLGMRSDVDGNTALLYPYERIEGDLLLTVHAGLGDDQGRHLAATTDYTLHADAVTPQVQFLQSGFIVPDSGRIILPVRSVNFTGIDVRISKIDPRNLTWFLQQNDLDDNYGLFRVQEVLGETHITLGQEDDKTLREWHTYALDLTDLIRKEPGSLYRIYMHGTQPLGEDPEWYDVDYLYGPYASRNERIRNLMVSDMGLVVKGDENGRYQITVSDLQTAEPMSGVAVTFCNALGRSLAEGTTSRDGTWSATLSETPAIVVARRQQQFGFLQLGHAQSLPLSSFDAAGAAVNDGLNGMIYGERGVWRPGDSLYLTFAMMDKTGSLPAAHPVRMELINPMGQVVSRQIKTRGENGLYGFRWATSPQSPTGRWKAQVTVGGKTFLKSLPIETIKANRVRIEFTPDRDILTSPVQGRLSAAYLTGMPAAGMEASVDLKLTAVKTIFDGFSQYTFDDPAKSFHTEARQIFKGTLDADGAAHLSASVAQLPQAPGMLQGRLDIRVAEENGNINSTYYTARYAPYRRFIGLRAPSLKTGERDYQHWRLNEKIPLDIAAVDSQGQPLKDAVEAQVDLYRITWSWWWDLSERTGSADYLRDIREDLVRTETVALQQGRGRLDLLFNQTQRGLYYVRVSFRDGGRGEHTAALVADVDTYTWQEKEGVDEAVRLAVNSDKKAYTAGETAQITAEAPDGAVALVSVENGQRQLASHRVRAKDGKIQFSLPLTREMSPNCYVFVTLLQPYRHAGNDLPLRMYGVIPVLVEDPATVLAPRIRTAETVRPGQPFEIQVDETSGRTMSYTLAVVDEGLWGLTRFKAPDLHGFFYAKEALGVRTWDMYNRVMGAYGGQIEQLFAIGGDGENLEDINNAGLQRFKPVAQYYGPFTLPAGQSRKHTVTLPPYIGRVHVTVVASDGTAFGTADRAVEVKQPLMVQATLPRMLAPDEEVVLPVTVFAMDRQVKTVRIQVQHNDVFSLEGPSEQTVTFNSEGEQTVRFKLRTAAIGNGEVVVQAVSGNETAKEKVAISVRNPNPVAYRSVYRQIPAGASASLSVRLPGEPDTNQAAVVLSTLPPLHLEQRLSYLIQYPHGCLEQIVSTAFPQLYLDGMAELTEAQRQSAGRYITSALARLENYRTASGGFAYWPGNTSVQPWCTSYAGLFMLEAERHGYALPAGLKSEWLKFQRARAGAWRNDSHSESSLTQAYRLYSLAEAQQPDMSAMNRLKELPGISAQTRWLLAAAYLLAGQPETARSLTATLPQRSTDRSADAETFGSVDRDDAIITEVLTAMDRKEEGFTAVRRLSERLASDEYMSTQATAMALKAVAGYMDKYDISAVPVRATFETDEPRDSWTVGSGDSTSVTRQMNLKQHSGDYTARIRNNTESPMFAVITASGVPATGQTEAYHAHLRLDVSYEDMEGRPINVRNLPQHKDFVMVTRVAHTALERGHYRNMALTAVFPSGWEILNDRLGEEENTSDAADYQDIRDDRVCTYFDLPVGGEKVFRTRLSAAYAGTFHHPAVSCEAMYDHEVRAATESFVCSVE